MKTEAFDLTERTLAFAPALVEQLPALVTDYGAEAYDAGLKETFPVVYARWDDDGHTRVRAASRESEEPVVLSDGRLAVENALFSRALLDAVRTGEVGAKELGAAEVSELRVVKM